METMQTLLERRQHENNEKLESLARQEMRKISQELNENLTNSLNTRLDSLEKDTKEKINRLMYYTENATLMKVWKLILVILIPLLIINTILYFWLINPRISQSLPREWQLGTDKKTILIPMSKVTINQMSGYYLITPKD